MMHEGKIIKNFPFRLLEEKKMIKNFLEELYSDS